MIQTQNSEQAHPEAVKERQISGFMSSITRTSNTVMTDIACLNEALESSDCTVHNTSSNLINVTAGGRQVTINKSRTNGHWYYRFEQGQEYRMRDFEIWFRELEGIYTNIVQEKKRRIEEEKQRQKKLAKEAEELRHQAARTQQKLDSKSQQKLSQLETEMSQSMKVLAESQRQLDSVEKSRMKYVKSTEVEIKERADEGGWKIARDNHDPARRVSRMQFRRVSN